MKPTRSILVAGSLLLAACSATPNAGPQESSSNGPWLNASPVLQQQIEDEALKLPWTHGVEHLEQIHWFASVGEPAYETLLELAADENDKVSSAAFAALGATGDRRLVPYVQRVTLDAARIQSDLGYERARTLTRLGDWSEVPRLIRGLQDERLFTRALCIDTLEETVGDSLGFRADAPEIEREVALERWDEWWLARTGEGILDR